MDEEQIEREEIEAVFALGGGELEDEPWEGFAYWYEGPPSYAAHDYSDRFDREYRTAIVCELFGQVQTPDGWERVASFASSGEAECPWRGCDGLPSGDCPLCEESCEDGTHPDDGYVYIGDGWREVVYRAPIMVGLPNIKDVANDLHSIARFEAEGECDVRLNVQRLDWGVKWGPSDYDQDHRGFWGAASIGPEMSLEDCRSVARELLDQVSEAIAMTDGYAVEGEEGDNGE